MYYRCNEKLLWKKGDNTYSFLVCFNLVWKIYWMTWWRLNAVNIHNISQLSDMCVCAAICLLNHQWTRVFYTWLKLILSLFEIVLICFAVKFVETQQKMLFTVRKFDEYEDKVLAGTFSKQH